MAVIARHFDDTATNPPVKGSADQSDRMPPLRLSQWVRGLLAYVAAQRTSWALQSPMGARPPEGSTRAGGLEGRVLRLPLGLCGNEERLTTPQRIVELARKVEARLGEA
jgi:hypothetical protein